MRPEPAQDEGNSSAAGADAELAAELLGWWWDANLECWHEDWGGGGGGACNASSTGAAMARLLTEGYWRQAVLAQLKAQAVDRECSAEHRACVAAEVAAGGLPPLMAPGGKLQQARRQSAPAM